MKDGFFMFFFNALQTMPEYINIFFNHKEQSNLLKKYLLKDIDWLKSLLTMSTMYQDTYQVTEKRLLNLSNYQTSSFFSGWNQQLLIHLFILLEA